MLYSVLSNDTIHKANVGDMRGGGVALSSCGGGNFLNVNNNNERIPRCLADEWFSYTAVTHRCRGKPSALPCSKLVLLFRMASITTVW